MSQILTRRFEYEWQLEEKERREDSLDWVGEVKRTVKLEPLQQQIVQNPFNWNQEFD